MSLNSLKGFVHLSVCFSPVHCIINSFNDSHFLNCAIIEISKVAIFCTVELRSKGPATKGNRSLRDNGAKSRLFPFSFLLFEAPARWDTAIRETSAFGKEFSVPWSIFPRPERFFSVSVEEEEGEDEDEE